MLSELRFAFRQWSRLPASPSWRCTLALGIGVNHLDVHARHSCCFRSAPIAGTRPPALHPGPHRPGQPDGFSYPEIEEMRALAASGPSTAFESITASAGGIMTCRARPTRGTPGLARRFGRFLPHLPGATDARAPYSADEEVPAAPRYALLSHKLWLSRFGAIPASWADAPAQRRAVTVIGVMPPSFGYPPSGVRSTLRPMTIRRHIVEDRNNHFFGAVGRLRPGVTANHSHGPVAAVARPLGPRLPQVSAGRGVKVMLLQKAILNGGPFEFITWLLFGVGAAVLLIACFNLAISSSPAPRVIPRSRGPLGARGVRSRLIVHQLTESMVLALSGGVSRRAGRKWSNDLIGRSIPSGHGTLHLEMTARFFAERFWSRCSAACSSLVPAWIASRATWSPR